MVASFHTFAWTYNSSLQYYITRFRIVSKYFIDTCFIDVQSSLGVTEGLFVFSLRHIFSVFFQEQRSEVVIEIENETVANDSVTGCGSESGKLIIFFSLRKNAETDGSFIVLFFFV